MISNISDTIVSVGVDDPDARLFENQYALPHGMSYNSYALLGGSGDIAVLDSVEAGFGEQWIRQTEEATGGDAPRWLVAHHAEPDHSANIVAALEHWPGCTLVASQKCLDMIANFHPGFDFSGRTRAVKEGDILEAGTHSLRFIAAPMIHWPEVMMSYDETEKVLFSADGFGRFGSIQYDPVHWVDEARRYYCNIVGKYGPMVQSLLKKVSGLEIRYIAPLHGPVLKAPVEREIDLYNRWSTYTPETRGVMVAYASIYGNTAACALRLAEMLRECDCGEVYTADLTVSEPSEAVGRAFRYGTIVLCAPTYDAGVYPAMKNFLNRLVSKGIRNRRIALVQNGTWAPVAASVMRKMLEDQPGMEFLEPVVTIHSSMKEGDLQEMARLADAVSAPEGVPHS